MSRFLDTILDTIYKPRYTLVCLLVPDSGGLAISQTRR